MSQIERVIKGADSCYLLGDNGGIAAVMKFDEQMAKLWQRTLSLPMVSLAVDGDELDDGSILFAIKNENLDLYDDWIYHLSADGQDLGMRTLTGFPSITSIRTLKENSLVCGFSGSTGPHVIMLDATGNLSWTFEFGSAAECKRLHRDPSMGVVNYLLSGNSTYQLGELDSLGQDVWHHSLNIAAHGIDPNFVLVPLQDGEFVIGSTIELSPTPEYIYLAKLGASGSITWQTNFRPTPSHYWNLGTVHEQADGSFYIAGSTRSDSYDSSDAFIARLDSEGELEWIRVLDSDNFQEYGIDLVILDEMIILLGYRFGGATETILAIKMDFDGHVIFE